MPLGGYSPVTVSAWVPAGQTGVIRGAPRNTAVVAWRVLSLLMLPGAVYLRWWHSAATLRARLSPLHSAVE